MLLGLILFKMKINYYSRNMKHPFDNVNIVAHCDIVKYTMHVVLKKLFEERNVSCLWAEVFHQRIMFTEQLPI